MREILIYYHIKYGGDWDKIYKALEDRERVSVEDLMKVMASDKDKDYITILDKDYPEKLKSLEKPTFVIERDNKVWN